MTGVGQQQLPDSFGPCFFGDNREAHFVLYGKRENAGEHGAKA